MSPGRQSALIAGVLIALAVLLTWPLASRLDSAVLDLGDPLFTSWTLAWDFHALRRAPLRLFDANIFHPHRWTLAYSDHLLGLLPLAAPVHLAGGGPVLMHNVVLFATFPLSALAMFWLVRSLTGLAGAGVVAGILYAFSHYRFSHLGHVQLLSHHWLPLMLLGLHRAVASEGRWRHLALAALAFAVQALSSGYYAYISAVAVGTFAVWVAAPAARPPLGRAARRGLLAAVLTAALLAPVFVPYYLVQRDLGLRRPISEVAYYSARPSSYLAASPENRWFGDLTASLRRPEGTLFPGALMLVLAAVGAVTALAPAKGRRREAEGLSSSGRGPWPRALDGVLTALLLVTLGNALFLGGFVVSLGPLRLAQRHFGVSVALITAALLARRFMHGRAVPLLGLGWLRRLGWPHAAGYYLAVTGVGLLCSFGPTLWLGDRPVAEPLYRQLYELVPGFDALRVPARFAMLVSTGLAVLAGYGVAATARRVRGRAVRIAAVAALGGLAAAEAWAVPLPFRWAPTEPGPADRWLARATAPGAVVVLPMHRTPPHLETPRLLGSVAHWRPLVNGYSSVFPSEYSETVETLNAFPADAAVGRLRALRVRYVVVYLGQYPDDARGPIEAALKTLPPGIVEVATFDATVLLEVRPPP